ncbi:MAG: GerAB/ArcD/ProY family transporter [Desulfocucumaceae bacterium]
MLGYFQFAMLVSGFLLGTAVILLSVPGESAQDMWVVALTGWAIGSAYVLFLSLCQEPKGRHPVAGFLLSLYVLHLAALVTRNMGEILNLTLMTHTPQVLLNSLMTLVAAYGAYKGIEVISRLAAPFVLISFLVGVLLIALAAPVMSPENLLPVFEHDWKQIIKGSLSYASFPYMETVVFLPLLKLTNNPRKALLYGTILAGSLLFVTILTILLVLPPGQIKSIISPTFLTINSIPGEVFVKALVVVVWMQTGFLKLSILLYVLSNLMAGAFNVEYRKLILPLSVLVVAFSLLVYNNMLEMSSFAVKIYPYYAIPIQLGFTLYYCLAGRMSAARPKKSNKK